MSEPEKLSDEALLAYTRRRMEFTLQAQVWGVPTEVQQQVAYGDPDVRNATHMNDEATRRGVIDRVVDELVAEGLAEETAYGFMASNLLLETGIDRVEDEAARQVLRKYRLESMWQAGTMPQSTELSEDERAWLARRLGSLSGRVDFAVHEPRHDPAA